MVRHSGGHSDGSAAEFRRYLDDALTLIVLSNRHGETMLFGSGLVERIDRLAHGEYVPFPPMSKAADDNALQALVGEYVHNQKARCLVALEAGRLVLRAYGQAAVDASLGLRETSLFEETNERTRRALDTLGQPGEPPSIARDFESILQERRHEGEQAFGGF